MGYLLQERLHLPAYRSSRGLPCLTHRHWDGVCACGVAGPARGPARISAVPPCHLCSGKARSSASGLSSGSPESRALGNRHNTELGSKHGPSLLSASTPMQLHCRMGTDWSCPIQLRDRASFTPFCGAEVHVQLMPYSLWHRTMFTIAGSQRCWSTTT